MILQSLVDYYEILEQSGNISRPGYTRANVSYALELSHAGELSAVIPLKQTVQRGKKTVEIPQSMEVPVQKKRASGVTANFLCDNAAYILGIAAKKKDKKGTGDDDNPGQADKDAMNKDVMALASSSSNAAEDKPYRTDKRTVECFKSCRELHHAILDGVDSVAAGAILSFLDNWVPEKAGDVKAAASQLKELTEGGNIIFSLEGKYVQNDPDIRQAWDAYHAGKTGEKRMQCLITGKIAPVARLHPSIKKVRGGQPSGVSLVSFNDDAYESYGREYKRDKSGQGYNAPVSEYAAFAYGTALNHLLADDKSKQYFGDATVVYWALSPKKIYRDLFAFSLEPKIPGKEESGEAEKDKDSGGAEWAEDKKTAKLLRDIFTKLAEGKPIAEVTNEIDEKMRFFILGLSPNAARASVRFFLQNEFGSFLQNIMLHYHQLEIEHSTKDFVYLPLWKLMLETVSPNSRDKAASPLLSGAVLRAIFTGGSYPAALLSSVMLRIHAGDEISRGKAAIIKAFLSRNSNKEKYKEVLTVSLNEQSENKAYVLGRLFAVLEKAQLDANPGINATIKDRYFSSACATPRSVFPVLLRLSNYYITKSDYGYVSEKRINQLMQKLNVEEDPFPAHLSLQDQGIFILGYYHQKNANFAPRKDRTSEKDKITEKDKTADEGKASGEGIPSENDNTMN